jgi:methyl-accepting chemotaxis protein
MKISTKLSLFYVAVLAVFCVLALALASVLHSVSAGYEALLESPVRQMDQARVVQVNFKKQVQEWKDILLRGRDPDDLAAYTRQFREKEAQVRESAKLLAVQVQDPQARQLLDQFIAAHILLGQKYQQAYDAYVSGIADFKAADKVVHGQDRTPTDLFDQVVERLDLLVQESVKAQTRAALDGRNLSLGVAGTLLVLFGVIGFFLVQDIVGRLARLKVVSDRLARADISGLAIDASGHDEIADFGRSLTGVHAAIEELIHLSREQTVVNS